MELRKLGRTGLTVSRIGVGLAALGRPGYINLGHAADLRQAYDVAAMEQHAHAVLDAAWQAGVRYFDAARSYGRAEEFLASWLRARHLAPGAVIVGSKWGYTYTAGWQVAALQHEVKDHTLATLRRQYSESRGCLGHHLGLYQIHSATLQSGVLQDREVHAELAMLRATGLKIGLTVSGPAQAETVRQALEVTVSGVRLFDCVQATWNLLETSAGPALRLAHDAGLGVIIKEALANGRLTSRNDDPAFASRRQMLEEIANGQGVAADALAIGAVLAQPWVDTALSGAATSVQLQSNLAALDVNWDEGIGDRLQSIAETPQSYWTTRSRLAWN